jgi:hypothetical protein
MAGTQLRQVGTTAQFAPVIKRAIATLSDGRTVSMVIDTNLAASSGTDVTGVAKIHLYVSNDASRTTFTLAASYAPTVAPASATVNAIASMSVASDNSVWVAWQGVDWSLNVTRWSYSAGALTFVANEVVQASGSISQRFRSIDIDLTGTATAAVAVYDMQASTGAGADLKVYVRNNSGTWVRSMTRNLVGSGLFVRAGSEDVSVAIQGGGVVSNVIKFLIYGTKTLNTTDSGDQLEEYSYNVSTGTLNSATLLGSWYTSLNKNQAAGTRRAMLFTIDATRYLIAGVVGAGIPNFFAIKLTSGNQSTPSIITKAGYVSTISLSNYFKIDPSYNGRTYWSATYKDNRLLFGFAGIGTGSSPRIVREVSMTFPSPSSSYATAVVDAVPRPSDSAFYGNGGPIAIYGGDNRRVGAGLKYYDWLAIYGPAGNTVSTSVPRVLRFVSEDTFDAPVPLSPYAVEPTSRPTYRVRVDNANLQPNLYGKIEINVATNSTFTASLKDIIQPDSALQYFGSTDGLSGGGKQVSVATPNAAAALTQGAWYWRARVVSDKDTPGAWSSTTVFSVSHPPSATPIFPTASSIVPYSSSNNYSFSWTRSDTEPTDTQTAYRLIVRRRDTFASIVDTGFVASSATSVTVSIDPVSLGLMDAPLDWSVQLKDADAVTGPASTAIEFAIGQIPDVQIVYPDGITPVNSALPTFTWTFSGNGGRAQKAYRVTVFDNTTPNLLTNYSFETGTTGWNVSAGGTIAQSSVKAKSGSFSCVVTPDGTSAASQVELSSAQRPATTPGQAYAVEGWINPTTVNKPIILGVGWYDSSMTFISSSSTTATPLANTWQYLSGTFTAPVGAAFASIFAGVVSTPGVGDTAYIDQLSLHLPSAAASNMLLDSYWLAGDSIAYTPTTQVLVNGHQYGVTVQVQDTAGLIDEATQYFSTTWTPPAPASGLSVTVPSDFKVNVSWTSTGQDSDFVAYRVYRRYMKTSISALDIYDSAHTWYLLFETSDDATSYSYDDYLAPVNIAADYVVVQVADRFGSLIESDVASFQTVTLTSQRYYFVPQVLLGGIASFEASNVTGDNFSREVEQETIHVVGRGRQVQIGDDLGYSGTLAIHLRNPATARRDREFFELVSSQYNSIYIKSPFGDVVLVSLGNIDSTRVAGYGGPTDFADLSIPYIQIIDEELTARVATT